MAKKKLEELEEDFDEEMEEDDLPLDKAKKEQQAKKATKPVKQTCKEKDSFICHIENYLENVAKSDEYFANCLKKKDKSVVECCAYIIGQIKGRHTNVQPSEVYQLARHYYQEDIEAKDLQIVYQTGRNAVVEVELTEEDKAKARELALAKVEKEIYEQELKEAQKRSKDKQKEESLSLVDKKKIEREAVEKYKAEQKAKKEEKKRVEAEKKAEREAKIKAEQEAPITGGLFDFL